MLPIFKATNHTNYLKEANLLVQMNIFSPRKAGQLLWSRCVNTHGKLDVMYLVTYIKST